MLHDVTSVKVIKDYILELEFEDGHRGCVDIQSLLQFEGIFSALKDKAYFDTVHVNPDLGTICWDNGADIAPELLYQKCSES